MTQAVCGYCRAPITDTPARCLVCGGTPHRPSAVLELPDQLWWCIACSKPWPCPDAPQPACAACDSPTPCNCGWTADTLPLGDTE